MLIFRGVPNDFEGMEVFIEQCHQRIGTGTWQVIPALGNVGSNRLVSRNNAKKHYNSLKITSSWHRWSSLSLSIYIYMYTHQLLKVPSSREAIRKKNLRKIDSPLDSDQPTNENPSPSSRPGRKWLYLWPWIHHFGSRCHTVVGATPLENDSTWPSTLGKMVKLLLDDDFHPY